MKKSVYCSFLIIGLIITACNRDDDGNLDNGTTIDEQDALEMVEQTIGSEVFGIEAQVADALVLGNGTATKSDSECGVLYEVSEVRQSPEGALTSYEYSVEISRIMVCEGDKTTGYQTNFDASGMLNAPRIESNDATSYDASLTGVNTEASVYTFNGSFDREGSQLFRIGANEKSVTTKLALSTTALQIDKSTQRIIGGTSTFSWSGTTSNGDIFGFNGSITHLGNGAATVLLNGTTYQVQI